MSPPTRPARPPRDGLHLRAERMQSLAECVADYDSGSPEGIPLRAVDFTPIEHERLSLQILLDLLRRREGNARQLFATDRDGNAFV